MYGDESVFVAGLPVFAAAAQDYDVILRNGTVIDGTGRPPYKADVAIRGGYILSCRLVGRREGGRRVGR